MATETIKKLIEALVENVLDDMGHKKATKSVRRGMIGGGAVYMDRNDPNKKRTKSVMKKVSKNLNKKPYSHDPPRMGLGESTTRLLEGKIDQAIAAAKDDVFLTAFLETLKQGDVLPKYVPWLTARGKEWAVDWEIKAKTYPNNKDYRNANYIRNNANETAEGELGVVNRFEKMLKLNRIPQDSKDILKYKDLYSLLRVVEKAEAEAEVAQQQKAAEKTAEKIYEDQEYLIIEPRSKEASCVYGKGTQWCISATQSKNYFDEYFEKGARFLFVINKKTGDKDAIAFAGDIEQIEIYDAQDNEKKKIYIEEKYPKPILDILNNFLQPAIGIAPFNVFSMEDLKRDPRPALNWDYFNNAIKENPEKGLKIIEYLATVPRDGWSNDDIRLANSRIRIGLGMIVDRGREIFNHGWAEKVIRIHKINPGTFALTESALKVLATIIISRQEEIYWPNYILPLVFYPERMKAILERYTADPIGGREHLQQIPDLIRSLERRIPEGFQNSSSRSWVDIVDTLMSGLKPDDIYNRKRLLDKLFGIGNKYNWDFVTAALNRVAS
jgi:hypothetical protein